MGNWKEQQDKNRETREKNRTRRESLGKLFHDFAKLSFAGLVIGGISPVFTDLYYMSKIPFILAGIIVTIILAWIGDRIYKNL